ncbi:MAG: MerR family transcriptional regulator [Proteobacteria bacterium]|nr:MerR family transcriptional regulator [Pseudomonadota bacterium]
MPRIPLPARTPPAPLTISDMAELFGVTHRTLHFYEEKGLISSSRAGAMRVYDDDDIARMAVVNACREGGMPVAAIQDMLAAMVNAASPEASEAIFRAAIVSCKRELTAGISTIRRQLQQLETLLSGIEAEDETEPAEIEIDALSPVQMQCLQLMKEGLDTLRIAMRLDIAPETAASLEREVIALFNATNRSQALAHADIAGFFEG